MKIRKLADTFVAAAILLATGCATQYQRVDHGARLAELKINPDVLAKVQAGDRLDLEDIESLSASGAEESDLSGYLRQSGARYELRSRDVTRLKEAGVSEQVIDTMLASQRIRRRGYVRYGPLAYGPWPHYRRGYYPYFGYRYGFCY